MASSSSGSHPASHYNTQAYPSPYHTLEYSPNAYDAGAQAAHPDFYALRGDQRLIAIVQHGANLELDTLKLLESKYRGKELRRWADNFQRTFGDVEGVEEVLQIVLRNQGIEGGDAAPFISTLVQALRDRQSALPASVGRREPSQGRASESAQQPAAAAATRADSRARLQSWLQAPPVPDIDDAKRRRIIDERALITDYPRTPDARDEWAARFCKEFFDYRQAFYNEDLNALLREVVLSFGVTGLAIDQEVSRLMQAISKCWLCNARHRTTKRVRPAQARRS